MRRREFLLLGTASIACPGVLRAQQAGAPVIGFLHSGARLPNDPRLRAFREGLKERSYVEGTNVAIEFRWAENKYERLPALAADLVERKVAVIFANYPPVLSVMAATKNIPIVFITGGDPVERGLVSSLNRPGGNVTGVTNLNAELGAKRLELLHEVIPSAESYSALINSSNPSADTLSRSLTDAARSLGMKFRLLHASSMGDLERLFADLASRRGQALMIGTDPFFIGQSEQLAQLALKHAIPTIFQYREFAVAGGLMSYGGDSEDNYRQAGIYTGRILKGEKPADLPVQQTTRVELIVNLKTAKALGVTVPLPLLARADEVIE